MTLTQQPLKVLKPLMLLLSSDIGRHDHLPKVLESHTRVLHQMINNRAGTLGKRSIFRNRMRPGRPNLELLLPLEDGDVTTGKLAANNRHEIGRVTFFFGHAPLEQGQQAGRKKISTNIPNDPGTI